LCFARTCKKRCSPGTTSHELPQLGFAAHRFLVDPGYLSWQRRPRWRWRQAIAGIGPTGKIIKLHTGFKFTEGPTPDRQGSVYFSDIPNERIHKVDKDGTLLIFREKSNRSNGLKVNAKGEIVACEMAGRVVAISPDGNNVRVLADNSTTSRSMPRMTWSSTSREASMLRIPPSALPSRCHREKRVSITSLPVAR
jgi:hypothetical protein